jgi:hypothetical protein
LSSTARNHEYAQQVHHDEHGHGTHPATDLDEDTELGVEDLDAEDLVDDDQL